MLHSQKGCSAMGMGRAIFCIALLGVLGSPIQSNAQTNTTAWTFVSSPDWFNADIADLSGSTAGVSEADGWDSGVSKGLNGVSPQMRQVFDQIVGEMSAYDPELFLVAGDLVNGRWFEDAMLDMFDPKARNRTTSIDKGADIYYGWYKWLFREHGFGTVLGAIGDHEIGDDDWPPGSEKSNRVSVMKRAFHRNMVSVLGLPSKINGADARPVGTPHEYGSYAVQHKNVLFVTVDVFRQSSPTQIIHPRYRTVSPEVIGAHLNWLTNLLKAADRDGSIDHVIVQGHVPILNPVRMQRTSGTMLVDREDSGLWQLLRRHDHRRGGKVRLYLSGEVHAVTATRDNAGDTVQIVHGDPPRGAYANEPTQSNYAVFTVSPEQIDVELRRITLQENGNSLHWQPNDPRTSEPSSASSSVRAGRLSIDLRGAAAKYSGSGMLTFVNQTAPAVHFGFDATTEAGNFSNTGSIGNDWYEGKITGLVTTPTGKFGDGARLSGSKAFVESGRGNVTEGEQRTVSAWVKTEGGGNQTVFSYGADKSKINGRFNFQLLNGALQVNISGSTTCAAAGAPKVNNGKWHHVAVVLTDDHDNRCADMLFYVDGNDFSAASSNASALVQTLPWANMRIGADNTGNANFFSGTIDDVAMWAVALTDGKTRSLATAGNHPQLSYDALAMQALFSLFDAGKGSATVRGDTWVHTSGLRGRGGDVIELSNGIAIQFDDAGNGVATGNGSSPPPPPPPSNQALYEGEQATRSSGFRVLKGHPGYTGSGYVDYVGEGYVQWSVNVASAGSDALAFRYALGSGNRPLRILVDGKTTTASLAFPATGSWDTWGEVQTRADLGAGTHTIRAQTTGASGANMDHLRLDTDGTTPPPTPPPSNQALYEGEQATRSSGFRVLKGHPGYTGSGYVDYVGEGYVQWSVNVASAGSYALAFRYALGSGNRPLRILVDGKTTTASLAFLATGSWDKWGEVQTRADLGAGTHTIRAQTTGVSGANMDHLRLDTDGIAPPPPPSPPPPPPPTGQTRFEAESAKRSAAFRVTRAHSGYTGTGYVDYVGEGFVQWTINSPAAGTYDLVFRYALEAGNRPLKILLDGSTLKSSLPFPATGRWTSWGEINVRANLGAGSHTVRAQTTGASGANMDHLALKPAP